MNEQISSSRNQSIDFVKIVAMFLIVDLHATWTFSSELSFVLFNLGVIAIPLFFMVSGYLLIGREGATYKYALKKIFAIMRFVFLIVGFVWLIHYSFSWWNLSDFFINYFGSFIQKGYYSIFWYFGSMILIYLIYPSVNKLYNNKKNYLIVLCLIAILQNCVFTSNITCHGEEGIAQTFRLWNWVSYFMLGGLMKFSIDRKVLVSIFALLFLCTYLVMKWLYPYMPIYCCDYFYSCPVVIALTVTTFLLINSFHFRNSRFIKECSKLFLPVYAIHPIVIIYTYKFRHWLWNFEIGCIIYWLFVLLATCLLSIIVLKISFMNRLFKL